MRDALAVPDDSARVFININERNKSVERAKPHDIHVHVPIKDIMHGPEEKTGLCLSLWSAAAWVEYAIKCGRTPFVYCHGGRSRAPAVVVTWLVRYRGYSVHDAVSAVTSLHPRTKIRDDFLEAINAK